MFWPVLNLSGVFLEQVIERTGSGLLARALSKPSSFNISRFRQQFQMTVLDPAPEYTCVISDQYVLLLGMKGASFVHNAVIRDPGRACCFNMGM
jgi:hypothetical protein